MYGLYVTLRISVRVYINTCKFVLLALIEEIGGYMNKNLKFTVVHKFRRTVHNLTLSSDTPQNVLVFGHKEVRIQS